MKKLIYIKKVDEYDDILSENYKGILRLFKEVIYIYKNMFNIITKKNIEGKKIWILPLQEKYSNNKITKIIKKLSKYRENTYVISNDLEKKDLYKLMDKNNISYLKGIEIKKYLGIKILEYINNIQNVELCNTEITMVVSDISEFNVYLIDKLSKIGKVIKVVTPNIYKFKNIEEKLYDEYGIALQFSNSYKKSLAKSKIIINLDYNNIDINEYEIFNKAIIINCAEDDVRIKSKLFNGIVINSCNIKFKNELRNEFRKMNIYNKYNSLVLYESNIYEEKNFSKIFEKLDEDKISIYNLIGNNGIINKNEFKNIFKKLDK